MVDLIADHPVGCPLSRMSGIYLSRLGRKAQNTIPVPSFHLSAEYTPNSLIGVRSDAPFKHMPALCPVSGKDMIVT